MLLELLLAGALSQSTEQGAPPWDLYAVSTEFPFVLLDEPAQGRRIMARVAVTTARKAITISWWATADNDSADAYLVKTESVSFYPTAMDRSWENLSSFYVAGRVFNNTRLEKWTFGSDYSLAVATNPVTGIRKTVFSPPTITREPLVVDPAMKNVSALTVNPLPPGGGTEEVWLFEWETRDVSVTNQATGLRELRVSSTVAAPYRTISMVQHSTYGVVCRFLRPPWGRQASIAELNNDFDLLVTYDQDLDGSIDGTETITFDDQDTHPMYATGSFSVPWKSQMK